MNSFVSS